MTAYIVMNSPYAYKNYNKEYLVRGVIVKN